MLDVAFISLISAGLAKLCQRQQSDALSITDVGGEHLIRDLLAAAPEPTGQLIERCVEDLWQSCQDVGLPAELAEPHLAILPALVHDADLTTDEFGSILDPRLSSDHCANLSKRIVAASTTNFAAHDIDETILSYLLEAFFISLAKSREQIEKIRPDLSELITAAGPQPAAETTVPATVPMTDASPSASAAAVTLAKIERADALGISVPLLDAITVVLINITRSADLRQADLLTAAANARNLIETLEKIPEYAPTNAEHLAKALNQFRAGRLIDCDQTLASIEDDVVKRTVNVSPPDAGLTDLATKIRAIRASLQALDGNFVKAARHFGFAQRYIARADYDARWRYAALETHYYELAAFYNGTADGLENAARACTSALAVIPPEQPLTTRATAQTELAQILLLLGEKEQQTGRFELAAQLLTDAHAHFAPEPESTNCIRAGALRADALVRLGQAYRKPGLLEQAAFLYQSAIEAASSQPAPIDDDMLITTKLGLRTRLALAMVATAVISNQTRMREDAIATIVDTFPDILAHQPSCDASGYWRCLLVAKCHLALAAWQTANEETKAGAAHFELAAREYEAAGFDVPANTLRNQSANTQTPASTDPSLTVSSVDAA